MSAPDRNRWDGWVMLVWLIAGLACIAAVILINQLGTMRVPERDVLGNISWTEGPNIAVWAAAIGQAGAGVLFAVLFSMVNSIYKNSCDQISTRAVASPIPTDQDPSGSGQASEEVSMNYRDGSGGVRIRKIGMSSQLEGIIHPGFLITSINDKCPRHVTDIEESVIDGENTIEFLNKRGERIRRTVRMKPGDLHLSASVI